MSLATLQAQLTSVQAAIASAEANGAEFSMTGAWASKSPDIKALYKREATLRGRILRLQGCKTNNLPDFS